MEQLIFIQKNKITGKKKVIKVKSQVRKAKPGTFNDCLRIKDNILLFKLQKERIEIGEINSKLKKITLTDKHIKNLKKIPRYFKDCLKDFFHDYRYIKDLRREK